MKLVREIGVDETHGRFATVTLISCPCCDQYWLRYFVEYESQSRSGRWARAPVVLDHLPSPEHAADHIARGAPVLAGGSYFDVEHLRSSPVNWDF